MSWIRRVFHYVRPAEVRMLVVGLDAAGKTTILYRQKLGEVVTTIPTIGFNVETVRVKNTNITIWDVGGCDKIRPLWRHYYQNTQVIMFVIDTNDMERLDEIVEDIGRTLGEDELRDAHIVYMLNKCDLSNARPQEVRQRIQEAFHSRPQSTGRRVHFQECCALTGDGLDEAFGWVGGVTSGEDIDKPGKGGGDSGQTSSTTSGKSSDTKVLALDQRPEDNALRERLHSSKDEPESAELFLTEFAAGKVARFDHRAHIRMAFHALLSCIRDGVSYPEATRRVLQLLKDFFANADKTQIRQTFHVTMTMYWVHTVHAALRSFLNYLGSSDATVSTAESSTDEELFTQFLERHLEVMWASSWAVHYSKELMMSPRAKAEYVLPDKKPLPAYLALDLNTAPTAATQPNAAALQSNHVLTDSEFFRGINENTLETFTPTCLARVCYIWMARTRQSQRRRGEAVSELMETLQSFLMKLRARQGTNAPSGGGVAAFSQTHTYFWVQMMDAALAALAASLAQSTEEDETVSVSSASSVGGVGGGSQYLPFFSFVSVFPELDPAATPWQEYYTAARFDSVEARREFTPPDVKPLPNVIDAREVSSLASVAAKRAKRRQGDNVKRPHPQSLMAVVESTINGPEAAVSDDDFLAQFSSDQSRPVTHYAVVRLVYLHLVRCKQREERRALGVSRIVDQLEAAWTKAKDAGEVGGTEDGGGAGAGSLEKMVLGDRDDEMGAVAAALNEEIESHRGLTWVLFWIQLVTCALARVRSVSALSDFNAFLQQAPELVWCQLYRLYYTEELFASHEARQLFVPPDLTKLPSYLTSN
eukprot:GFYU01003834.1.p1 GENE.GFYU01003834.1~~GFYU01003834.1.p1  ORF type:complete len:819 (-),score=232.03 GFYU01003834.1:171-2627(-)